MNHSQIRNGLRDVSESQSNKECLRDVSEPQSNKEWFKRRK